MSITIEHDTLCLGRNGLTIRFERTLRIPDDGKQHPLPPSLGQFPIRRVDDYADRVPADWVEHGGVFLPMYQREAMWLSFGRRDHRPRAVKLAVGKVCALTGKRWSERLGARPQDYLVTPPQPWLDGICVGKGAIRQFVAMPLGQGYTVEGQVTGEEVHGGLQLEVFEPKRGRFPDLAPSLSGFSGFSMAPGAPPVAGPGAPPAPAAPACAPLGMGGYRSEAPRRRSSRSRASAAAAMGLAAGGRMTQKIYPDPHGVDTWDPGNTSRVFVHICNSMQWQEITGERPPATPVSARTYAQYGLPWFGLYDEHEDTLAPSSILENVQSVAQHDHALFGTPQQDDEPIEPGPLQKLWTKLSRGFVRDGHW